MAQRSKGIALDKNASSGYKVIAMEGKRTGDSLNAKS